MTAVFPALWGRDFAPGMCGSIRLDDRRHVALDHAVARAIDYLFRWIVGGRSRASAVAR